MVRALEETWSTHSVKYSFREVLIQLSSRLREYEENRENLWHSYGLITPVQLCSVCHFQPTVSRLILTYDL